MRFADENVQMHKKKILSKSPFLNELFFYMIRILPLKCYLIFNSLKKINFEYRLT